jgi:hypothetical protein
MVIVQKEKVSRDISYSMLFIPYIEYQLLAQYLCSLFTYLHVSTIHFDHPQVATGLVHLHNICGNLLYLSGRLYAWVSLQLKQC